ncbi:hypothetical protein AVEN_200216-1, partial [Araneus ventricosus]
MDGDNENQEDDLDQNSENLGNWLRKRLSEASVYVSAENIAPTEDDDFKSTTRLYPKLSDEPPETPNKKRPPTKSNSSPNEAPNKVDTLVLRSTEKYAKPPETIKLDHLLRPDGDSASLLSIESAVFFDDYIRRIDFVLVYSIEPSDNEEHHAIARKIFEAHLKEERLELEHVYQ